MSDLELINKIKNLKESKNAIILAHYYQNSDIQDIADFVGDSLDLSRKAASTDADIIVFCGVTFMAEVAKILNPLKKVLVPDINAGCSLEHSCPPGKFKEFCDKYSDHLVVSYINCSAEVKALSDIIVTSSNAEKIIKSIDDNKPIIFAPDKNLGAYLNKKTNKNMRLWDGSCIVHEQFSYKQLVQMKVRYPDAKVIAHPECTEQLLNHANFIGSTSALIKYVSENKNSDFIVLTESGIIHQMQSIAPKSQFFSVAGATKDDPNCNFCNDCPYMKLNNLEKLYLALKNENPKLSIKDKLADAAKKPLDKMLSMSL